jgi:hypothetical protein
MTLGTITSESLKRDAAQLAQRAVSEWRPPSEYVDCKGLEAGFGIKAGLAYDLLASGDIEGVSLKRRGQQRGKRLFNVASVRAFLEKQAKAEEAKEVTV